METINCIFCTQAPSNTVIQENGFCGQQCKQCSLIYVSPRPTAQEVANLYGHDDAYIPAQAHIEHDYGKRLAAKHHLKIIKKYVQSGDLLEIGSGAGHFLDEARKVDFSPYGIELNPIQANFMANTLNIPCSTSPLSPQTFKSKKFDLIYHCDVISHYFDPIDELKKSYQALKIGGFLVFETGNIGDINKSYYKYFTRFQYPDHLFFFTEDNLTLLLEKTGFNLIKSYNYNILPQLMINKIVQKYRKTDQKNTPKKEKTPEIKQKIPFFKRFLKNSYHYGMHTIRYKIGSILPKKEKPQTIIVIAQKNNP